MKIVDIVIELMHKQHQYDIDVGDNSFFVELYNMITDKPCCYFEAWKSNVLTQLLKDDRFKCDKQRRGLRNNLIRVVELKEEYRL